VLRYKYVVHHEFHLVQMRSGGILYHVLAVFLKLNFAV